MQEACHMTNKPDAEQTVLFFLVIMTVSIQLSKRKYLTTINDCELVDFLSLLSN